MNTCEGSSHSTISTPQAFIFCYFWYRKWCVFLATWQQWSVSPIVSIKSQYFVLLYLPALSFPKIVSICLADFNTSPLLSFRVTGLMSMSWNQHDQAFQMNMIIQCAYTIFSLTNWQQNTTDYSKKVKNFQIYKIYAFEGDFFVIKGLNLPNSDIFGCKVFMLCETELQNNFFPKIIFTCGIILGCYSFKNWRKLLHALLSIFM